ncbi:hypothetical protein QJQ45_020968, partial [Haematococcus lacustris]
PSPCPSPCPNPLPLQAGCVDHLSFVRASSISCCPAHAMAMYMYSRFTVKKETLHLDDHLQFTQLPLFSGRNPLQSIQYDSMYEKMDQLFVSNGVDVASTTHAPRKGAPVEMAKSGVQHGDIKKHCGWSKDVAEQHYLHHSRMEAVLAMCGWESEHVKWLTTFYAERFEVPLPLVWLRFEAGPHLFPILPALREACSTGSSQTAASRACFKALLAVFEAFASSTNRLQASSTSRLQQQASSTRRLQQQASSSSRLQQQASSSLEAAAAGQQHQQAAAAGQQHLEAAAAGQQQQQAAAAGQQHLEAAAAGQQHQQASSTSRLQQQASSTSRLQLQASNTFSCQVEVAVAWSRSRQKATGSNGSQERASDGARAMSELQAPHSARHTLGLRPGPSGVDNLYLSSLLQAGRISTPTIPSSPLAMHRAALTPALPSREYADDLTIVVLDQARDGMVVVEALGLFRAAGGPALSVSKSSALPCFTVYAATSEAAFGGAAAAMMGASLPWRPQGLNLLGRVQVAQQCLASKSIYQVAFVQPSTPLAQAMALAVNRFVAASDLPQERSPNSNRLYPSKAICVMPRGEGGVEQAQGQEQGGARAVGRGVGRARGRGGGRGRGRGGGGGRRGAGGGPEGHAADPADEGPGTWPKEEWLLGPWAHLQLDPQVWGMGTTTLLDCSVKHARVRLHQLQRVSADPLYPPSGGLWPALWGVRPPRAAGEPEVAAVADGALRELELKWEASAQQVACQGAAGEREQQGRDVEERLPEEADTVDQLAVGLQAGQPCAKVWKELLDPTLRREHVIVAKRVHHASLMVGAMWGHILKGAAAPGSSACRFCQPAHLETLTHAFLTCPAVVPAWEAAEGPDGSPMLSEEELGRALQGCAHSKAPGLDGLPMEVYGRLWVQLGRPLRAMLQEALADTAHPAPLAEFLAGIITLVPKAGKPRDQVAGYRPITLLNCNVRQVARAVEDRLQLPLDLMVSPSQSAFILGMDISDSV